VQDYATRRLSFSEQQVASVVRSDESKIDVQEGSVVSARLVGERVVGDVRWGNAW
jgi:hypothetical protein